MGARVNIAGKKFNFLTAISFHETSKAGAKWLCICDCGNTTVVNSLKLRSGRTMSCGCYRKALTPNKRHGAANKTKTYKTWKEMRHRCMNANATQFKWYGGKGVSITDRWNDFAMFLEDMGERQPNTTLDRIDPSGNYEKSNCRWATPKQQAETNSGCFKKGFIPWNHPFLRPDEANR